MIKLDCIFCRIVKREIPANIIFENEIVLGFSDIKPQAPVHILVIPKKHIERISDLTDKDAQLVNAMMLAMNAIADKFCIKESGYRVIFNCNKDAGQEVFHIHAHLLGGRPMKWPPG